MYTVFLFPLGSTCVQKLRQFEFLTPAIKISFLFDFCTDVLLRIICCTMLLLISDSVILLGTLNKETGRY